MKPLLMILLTLAVSQASEAREPYSRRDQRTMQRTTLKVVDHMAEAGHLTPTQRLRLAIRLRFRPDTCCEILEGLAPELARLDGQDPSAFGKAQGGYSGLFEIDIDKIEQLFQLIIKYLPQIVDLIRDLFPEQSDVAYMRNGSGGFWPSDRVRATYIIVLRGACSSDYAQHPYGGDHYVAWVPAMRGLQGSSGRTWLAQQSSVCVLRTECRRVTRARIGGRQYCASSRVLAA